MTNNNIYFIANWKMYGHLNSLNAVKKVLIYSKLEKLTKKKIIYCPPYTLINAFINKTKNSNVEIGAQDCFENEKEGPFTGGICAEQIKKLGAKYVILGHSEKRINGDTNSKINKKIKSALNQKLRVILCVGETLKEYKQKKTNIAVQNQIIQCLKDIKNIKNILIAYEPVWSIGSGLIPDNYKITKVVKNIRKIIKKKFKKSNCIILYGGSVNQKNINKLKEINCINGYLIGGASRNANKFIDIVKKSTI